MTHSPTRQRPIWHPPRRNAPFCLLPHVADEYPALAIHLERSDGHPPAVTRSAAARTRQLNTMFDIRGPLVMLRFALPALNAHPLHTDELPALARAALDDLLWELLAPDAPYTVDIHRGGDGGTHGHVVVPLACVLQPWRDLIDEATHGPGGGRDLPFFAGHGVVIRNTALDRERVASYVRCHPDARLRSPGPQLEQLGEYLAGFDDEAGRKFGGMRLPRMGWDGGGLRSLSRRPST